MVELMKKMRRELGWNGRDLECQDVGEQEETQEAMHEGRVVAVAEVAVTVMQSV